MHLEWGFSKLISDNFAILTSAAHFSCFNFFTKNDKKWPIFREKRKIGEKSIFSNLGCSLIEICYIQLWNDYQLGTSTTFDWNSLIAEESDQFVVNVAPIWRKIEASFGHFCRFFSKMFRGVIFGEEFVV